MKKLLSVLLALVLLLPSAFAFADDDEDENLKDPEGEIDALMSLSLGDFGSSDETTDDPDVKAAGIAAIQETRFPDLIVLPQDGNWLKEWKTGYARKAFKAPCLRVERISKLHTGRDVMPYLYEGTETTAVAEENDMSLIIYRGSDNQLYAGWIQSIRLLDDFPGEQYTIGEKPSGDNLSTRNDITVDWSRCRWLTTQQNYSVLSDEVKNCVGFTLEYQLIKENTQVWDNILGPRKIYVKSGGEWIEVGEFPYPAFGAVKVQVWLDKPMDIDAVGTIAQCKQPDIFWFRQSVTDFVSAS
ncbi:MAG: hypothetical protein IKS55_11915 [Oscillospiraceae bacterium]|nr:hypothetical protein [Oscillospiraceae bacterium]